VAAQAPSAASDSAHHLGLIPHADLAQLDAQDMTVAKQEGLSPMAARERALAKSR